MPSVHLTQTDTERAHKIWAEYLAAHDVSKQNGQTAGIDPSTGQIWFGGSAADIVRQMDSADVARPLFFVRIGQETYLRKGGRH